MFATHRRAHKSLDAGCHYKTPDNNKYSWKEIPVENR